MPSHLLNLATPIPDSVKDYFTNQTSDTLQDIYRVRRSSSLYLNKGSLLRIQLENFLTHRDRTVDFQFPITLIHGQNGSGKSSILQAINFLINGKPSRVRDGAVTANDLKTQVLIKNTSESTHASYTKVTGYFWTGTSVLAIQRHHSTINQFKLNNFDPDKLTPITTSEAVNIFNSLNHFPDNTSTMISQSLMKKLAQLDPTSRYHTFQQATNLDFIESNTLTTCYNIKELENQISLLEDQVQSVSENAKISQQKIQENEQFSKIVIEGAGLQLEILSGECEEIRMKRNEKQIILQLYATENIEPIKAQINENELQLSRCCLEGQEAEKMVQAQKQVVKEQQQIVDRIMQDLGAEKLKFSREQMEQVRLENELQTIIQKRENSVKNIDKVRQRLSIFVIAPFLQRQPELPGKIQELSDEIERFKRVTEEITDEINQFRAEKVQLQQVVQNNLNEFEQYQAELGFKNQKLRSLELQLENRKSKSNIQSQIVKNLSVNDQQIFSQTSQLNGVFGPISAYCYVDEKFSRLGQVIQNYLSKRDIGQIVISNKENDSLVANMARNYSTISIKQAYEGKLLPDQMNGIKVVPLLSALVFANNYVKTALLMTKNIENVIIIQNMKDAIQIFQQFPRVLILPMDAQTILTYPNNSIQSKPLFNQSFSNVASGSLLFVHQNQSENDIQLGINSIKEEILQFQKQSEHFNSHDCEKLKIEQQIQVLDDKIANIAQKLSQNQDIISKTERQRQKSLQSFTEALSNYNKLKNDHENRIEEKQNLENSILNSNKQIQHADDAMPNINQFIIEQTKKTKQASLQFNAMKQIFDSENIKLTQANDDYQIISRSLDQYDKDSLALTLSNLQQKLAKFITVYDDYDKDVQQLNQLYQDQSVEIENKAANLENSQRVQKARNSQIRPLSAAFFGESKCDDQSSIDIFRNKIKNQCQESLQALHQLQITLNGMKNAQIDIIAETMNLKNLVEKHNFLSEELHQAKQQRGQLTTSACLSQLQIFSLRSRIQREMIAVFGRQSQELSIAMNLTFQFAKIPHLDQISEFWRAEVSPNITEKYDEFYVKSSSNEGKIELKSNNRLINTLSGGEQTFASICFITALCRVVQSSYLQIDEWDVFMDAGRREKSFKMISKVILNSQIQCVLVTPNDVDLATIENEQEKQIIGVVRLDSVVRM